MAPMSTVGPSKNAPRNGDVIIIGKHELRCVNDTTSLGEDAEKAVLIRRKPETMPWVEPKIDMPPRLDDAFLQILTVKVLAKNLCW